MKTFTLAIPDPPAMAAFGRRLADLLFPGAVIGLVGPLGAGKTFLVRAIAEGLGLADRLAVSSPTFVLIQEYPTRPPIYHFDAYRLRSAAEFLDLGAQEYFDGLGVCLVEWADRVTEFLPAERLEIGITPTGEISRSLRIAACGRRHELLLQWLEEQDNSTG
jgi:tRNA threonylcarbamoyladenosine biosynthesis protein TsaE